MLTIDEILDNEMIRYIDNNNLNKDFNRDKYYVQSINIDDIKDDTINITISYKTIEPSIQEDFQINGQKVSMDFVMIKQFDIPIDDYVHFLRGKKLSKITNGI